MSAVGDVAWDEARVQRWRGRASLAVGRHAEAVEALRIARRRRLGPEAGVVDLEEIDALFGLRRHSDALAVATRALRRRCLDADLEARLRVARGQALWGLGRVAAAAREVDAALRRASAELTRARAHEALGAFAWKEQDLEAAASQLARAADLYARTGSRDGLVRTLEKQAAVLQDAAAFDEALRVQTRRLEMASTTTRFDAMACASNDRGSLFVLLGRWREAREDLARAADLFRRVSDPREFTLAGVQGTALALAAGDLPGAREALAKARDAEPAQRSDPRTLGETLLFAADVELADGAAAAAAESLAQALGLFGLLRDGVGECRARYRLSHVLLALGRPQEAVQEARRALRIACWPRRSDLRAWSELALGRALLRASRPEAAAAFERALGLAGTRPVVALLARFGSALARRGGAERPELRDALAAVEAWGERRLLAYCFADLRDLTGERRPLAACPQGRPAPPSSLCATARVVADAAVAFAAAGSFGTRWCEAMQSLRPLLTWQRAALVSDSSGLVLRSGENQAARLEDDDLARWAVARSGQREVVDLAADPELASHPTRLLRGLRWAVVLPVGDGSTLYLETREGDAEPAGRQLDALRQVARLFAGGAQEDAGDEPPAQFPEIVGRCPAMEGLFRQIARFAGADVPLHVFGETGTGKEKVARALHRLSPRGARPFVAINASALSDELFEAELFGHVRGAFSGAVADRDGLVAEAEGGTLFLDEVTDLSPKGQAKVLRLLQEREYRRVGESRMRRADVRVITAANVPLERRVAAGLFREDLMYRMNAVVLALPPLRERGDDLLRLARHFLRRAAERAGRSVPALSGELASALRRYAWPGNVRELENEMTRVVALAGDGPARCEHLSPRVVEARHAPLAPLRDAVVGFEREHVGRVLALHAGNRSRAACALGLTRQGLLSKLRRLGIS
jgi:DNA-binding NtrC family response regulator/tetratricopeptide (TPR) repeat protein